MLVCSGCATKMPVPEVEEGRFEFSVTYEVNGEQFIYNGVYVCKYKGAYTTLVGKGIKWDSYIENGEGNSTILLETINEFNIIIDMDFDPDYFMDNPEYYEEKPEPYIYAESYDMETDSYSYVSEPDEIFEKFGFRIISYYYDEPIENNYNENWTFGEFEPTIN